MQENTFENVVCKTTSIVSWPQCVKEYVDKQGYIPTNIHTSDDIFTSLSSHPSKIYADFKSFEKQTISANKLVYYM